MKQRKVLLILCLLLACTAIAAYAEGSDVIAHEEFRNQNFTAIDANSHELSYDVYNVYTHASGGPTGQEDFVETRKETEAHNFSSGVCADCGYACTHPSIEEDEGVIYDLKVLSITEDTHTISFKSRLTYVCTVCGEVAKTEESSEDGLTEEHSYGVDDTCIWCEKPMPEATPVPEVTPTPTVSPAPVVDSEPVINTVPAVVTATPRPAVQNYSAPAPVVTAAPAVQTVTFDPGTAVSTLRGVADDGTVMAADAVATIGESLEREVQSGANVTVVNLDLMLDDQEMSALEQLPVKDQLLVVFAAIGHSDIIPQNELSDQASALVQRITQRIARMNASEKAAFETLLAEAFPVETVQIDGKSYDFFVIDLEIVQNGAIKMERYGFRQAEDGQWVLTQINSGVIVE